MKKYFGKFLISTLISFSTLNTNLVSAEPGNNLISAIANVQLSGSVKKPGIYKVPKGTRLVEVISKAGGIKKDAWAHEINLTTPVKDGDTIYIPSQKEKNEVQKVNIPIIPVNYLRNNSKEQNKFGLKTTKYKEHYTNSKNNNIVNLNTASIEELDSLPGIGPKLAKDIVRYRAQHGRFRDISELKNVGRIGSKKFNKLAKRVHL